LTGMITLGTPLNTANGTSVGSRASSPRRVELLMDSVLSVIYCFVCALTRLRFKPIDRFLRVMSRNVRTEHSSTQQQRHHSFESKAENPKISLNRHFSQPNGQTLTTAIGKSSAVNISNSISDHEVLIKKCHNCAA